MPLIIATARHGDVGPTVANLQDALSLRLDRQVIRALVAPNRPTADELAGLARHLKEERVRSTFGEASQLVRHFQVQQGLGEALGGVVQERTAARLEEVLRALGGVDELPFKVSGIVTSSTGAAVNGARVRAYERDMRTEEKLGEAVAGPDGNFRIADSPQFFRSAEKRTAGLRVSMLGADGAEVASSPVQFNAPAEAVVDLVVPAPVQTEFQRLMNAVRPLLKGRGKDGADLSMAEYASADIALAARDTGEVDERIRPDRCQPDGGRGGRWRAAPRGGARAPGDVRRDALRAAPAASQGPGQRAGSDPDRATCAAE